MTRLTHGAAVVGKTMPEYRVWMWIRNRCNCQTATGYHRYGGRGIRVCERWASFETFLADMGRRPSPLHQIDRIDVNGNYEPSNCRWVTKSENMRNTRVTRMVTLNGITKSVAEWAEQLGISADTIRVRLHRGKTPAEALRSPQ
jgi:hypothetical protein